MAKRLSIKQEMRQSMKNRIGYGRSKHEDKMADRQFIQAHEDEIIDTRQLREHYYFHTKTTFEACVNRGTEVLKYLKNETGKRYSPADVTVKDIEKYLDYRTKQVEKGDITPRTLAKERSQIAKAFNVDLKHYDIPDCPGESQKGRGRDAHWNPANHKDQVEFWSMIGARKGEYRYLTEGEKKVYCAQFEKIFGFKPLEDIHGRICNLQPFYNENGQIVSVAVIHAKHGKTNLAEVIPDNQARLTEMWAQGIDQYLKPSDHANVHACRRQYAQDLYNHYKRDLSTLPTKDKYICRGEYKGRVYDKQAVALTAVSLGHAEHDLKDTIHNYLR